MTGWFLYGLWSRCFDGDPFITTNSMRDFHSVPVLVNAVVRYGWQSRILETRSASAQFCPSSPPRLSFPSPAHRLRAQVIIYTRSLSQGYHCLSVTSPNILPALLPCRPSAPPSSMGLVQPFLI